MASTTRTNSAYDGKPIIKHTAKVPTNRYRTGQQRNHEARQVLQDRITTNTTSATASSRVMIHRLDSEVLIKDTVS